MGERSASSTIEGTRPKLGCNIALQLLLPLPPHIPAPLTGASGSRAALALHRLGGRGLHRGLTGQRVVGHGKIHSLQPLHLVAQASSNSRFSAAFRISARKPSRCACRFAPTFGASTVAVTRAMSVSPW